MQLRVIDKAQDFLQLKAQWTALYEKAPAATPFLSFPWLSTWWRHFGQGHRLYLLCAFEGAELIAAAPFYIHMKRRYNLQVPALSFIGDNDICPDFLDCLVARPAEKAFFDALERHMALAKDFAMITLSGIATDSPYGAFWQKLSGAQRVECRNLIECPYIDLPDSFETYLQNFQSYSSRATTRRKIRALTKAMPWRFEVTRGEEVPKRLESFARLNIARLEDRGLVSGFRCEAFFAFHRDVIEGLVALDLVEFHFVRSGEHDIIGLYFLTDQDRRRLFFYQHGWTPEFQKFSPGVVGVASSIEYAISQGTKEYHFLRGEEGFKYHWSCGTKQLITVFGTNRNTARGLLAEAALTIKGRKAVGG